MSNGNLSPAEGLPFRDPAVVIEQRPGGEVLLKSPYDPGRRPLSVAHLFCDRAVEHPERPFVLQRAPSGEWRGVTYGAALAEARALGQWLLERGATASSGVMILSGNSVQHAVLTLAAAFAGVPAIPLSEGYSLASNNFEKLLGCVDRVTPCVLFAQDSGRFAAAFDAVRAHAPTIEILTVTGETGHDYEAAARTVPCTELAAAFAGVGPSTVAKYLFTSGSTGTPKAVPQTQEMMTAMIAAREGLLDDPDERFPQRTLDWMPWSHLSAGNITFNHNIWAGGTYYIDDGRPVAGLFETTLRSFIELSPPIFASAPIAFEMLANALEQDRALCLPFFSNLRWMVFGGAALSSDIHARIQALSIEATGREIPIITTYGSTECQGITTVHWVEEAPGLIGLPLPGVELKLAPTGGKLEVRVRGDVVMPGYLGDEERTAAAFDEEGFYRLGDAARFVDPENPEAGLLFDGRVAEDFKLSSGTWVSVGTLRPELVAHCSPLIRDLVITGQDRRYLAAMVWPGVGQCPGPELAERIAQALSDFNKVSGGTSRRIERFALLHEPPSIDAGETTEKGYVNQRRVIERRSELVERLYASEATGDVISVA